MPVNSILMAGRNVAKAITNSARERETNLLVLGWKGKIKKRYYEMGSNLDDIIESAPCDCMVVKPGVTEKIMPKSINNILMPTNGGYHSPLSAEMANIFTETFDAEVTLFNVNNREEDREEIENRLSKIIDIFDEDRLNIDIKQSDDIVQCILEESQKNYQLIIMGSTEEGYFQQLLFGKISEKVATECEKTLILIKRNIGLRSLARRWLGRRDYLKKEGVN